MTCLFGFWKKTNIYGWMLSLNNILQENCGLKKKRTTLVCSKNEINEVGSMGQLESR